MFSCQEGTMEGTRTASLPSLFTPCVGVPACTLPTIPAPGLSAGVNPLGLVEKAGIEPLCQGTVLFSLPSDSCLSHLAGFPAAPVSVFTVPPFPSFTCLPFSLLPLLPGL